MVFVLASKNLQQRIRLLVPFLLLSLPVSKLPKKRTFAGGKKKAPKTPPDFLVKVLEFQVQPFFLIRVLSRPGGFPSWLSFQNAQRWCLMSWRYEDVTYGCWELEMLRVDGQNPQNPPYFFFTTKSWKFLGSYNNQSKTILQVIFLWYRRP